MGIEMYLVRDDSFEIYNLGKGWDDELGAALGESRHGEPFHVLDDPLVLSTTLATIWGGNELPRGYMLRVAKDVIRWSAGHLVRLTSDASFDGWWVDGRNIDGEITGSRYTDDHPEWIALADSATVLPE